MDQPLAPPAQPQAPAAQPQAPLAQPQGGGWSRPDCEQVTATAKVVVGHKFAHKFLRQWRAENEPGAGEDLTNNRAKFDWPCYLGQHCDRALIFGDGLCVDLFGIRSMRWLHDSNTHTARVDFIVRRRCPITGFIDAVRLHPSSTGECKPVVHEESPDESKTYEELWHTGMPPPAHAAPQGAGNNTGHGTAGDGGKGSGRGDVALGQRKHYRGASAADLIPTHVVETWVASRLRSAAAGTFTMDVSNMVEDPAFPRDQMFLWFLWFNKERDLRRFVDRVREVWMVKVRRDDDTYEAGFWFRTTDDRRAYFVTFYRKQVIIEDEPAGIDWTL